MNEITGGITTESSPASQALSSIRFNRESDSNVIDASDLHSEKHDE
jgi:hypothetical protein